MTYFRCAAPAAVVRYVPPGLFPSRVWGLEPARGFLSFCGSGSQAAQIQPPPGASRSEQELGRLSPHGRSGAWSQPAGTRGHRTASSPRPLWRAAGWAVREVPAGWARLGGGEPSQLGSLPRSLLGTARDGWPVPEGFVLGK